MIQAPPADLGARPLNRLTPWLWGLLALWVLIAALFAYRLAGQALDDVFITYRYARSFAEGQGLVFNPGERVFGTTAPGWALVLGTLSWLLHVPVNVLGTLSTAASLLALATLLLFESRRSGRTLEAAVAGTLILGTAYFWVHNGLEVFPALTLLAIAARLTDGAQPAGRRDGWAGLLAGAAVWLRPESGLAAGLLALLLAGRRRRIPWVYGVVLAAMVAAGLAAATWWFGSPLPQTFAAKRLQAAWNAEAWRSGLAFWPEAWSWLLQGHTGSAGPGLVLVAGGMAGWVVILRRGGLALRLLVLYALALLVAYPLLGVPFYTWYPIPVILALTYGLVAAGGAGVRALLLRLRDRSSEGRLRRGLAVAAVLALLVLAAWPAERTLRRTWGGFASFQGMPRYLAYRAAGEWLHDHAPAGADLAYVEVGTVAYFSGLPVRDLLGLVSPGVLPYVERHDLAGAFANAPTTYVLDSSRVHGLMSPVLTASGFTERYGEVARVPIPGSDESVVIYQRHDTPIPP